MAKRHLQRMERRLIRTCVVAAALMLGTWVGVSEAVVIEAVSGSLDATGTDTVAVVAPATSSPWAFTGLTATLPAPAPATPELDPLPANTDILVVTSFSSRTRTGNGQTGAWQIRAYDVATNGPLGTSDVMHRYLKGTNDEGMVSIAHLFSNYSGRVRFELWHQTTSADNGEQLNTFAGNIGVTPLLTVDGDALNGQVATASSVNSPISANPHPSNWGDVVSVSVDLDAPGDVLLVATFDAAPGAANDKGYFRLVDSGTNQLGARLETLLVNAGEPSTFALFGIANNLATAGTYTFRLQHTVDGGAAMVTDSVALVAVALSLPDGRRFEAYQSSNSNQVSDLGNDGTPTIVTSDTFELVEESDVFVMSQFDASTTGGIEARFQVGVDATFSEYGQFTTASASDVRGGSSLALVEDRAAGSHTSKLVLDSLSGTGQQARVPANGSNLVTVLLNTAARIEGETVLDLYRAYIHVWERESGRRVTILDTCRARSIGEARAAFDSRHPGARIVSLLHIRNATARGYRLFLGGVRTADGRNIKDTCYALNPAQARKILGWRSPGGVVNHIGLYPVNRRAVTYYSVTQRPDLLDTMTASDLKDAYRLLGLRYPGERIVRVTQISNENPFKIFEGMIDPQKVTEVLRAPSADAAAALALAKHARHRVLSVESSRSADGVATYEGRLHTKSGQAVRDNCSARSASEAQHIFKARHGKGSSPDVAKMDLIKGYRLFKAGVSLKGQERFADATFARTAAEATDILRGRYSGGSINSAVTVSETVAYREYQGKINTDDSRTVVDTCWALSPSGAKKIFRARFAEGKIRSVSRYGNNRLNEYKVVLKGTVRRERCEARDKAEAYRLLATRFPNARVVTVQPVVEVPDTMVFKATLNTADHRTVVDTVSAKSSGDARRLFVERYPGSRFTSLQRVTDGRVDETYEGRIDLPPAKDTCQASSPSEALHYFRARYPRSSTSALRTIQAGG